MIEEYETNSFVKVKSYQEPCRKCGDQHFTIAQIWQGPYDFYRDGTPLYIVGEYTEDGKFAGEDKIAAERIVGYVSEEEFPWIEAEEARVANDNDNARKSRENQEKQDRDILETLTVRYGTAWVERGGYKE
jgi:hypothetical protein